MHANNLKANLGFKSPNSQIAVISVSFEGVSLFWGTVFVGKGVS